MVQNKVHVDLSLLPQSCLGAYLLFEKDATYALIGRKTPEYTHKQVFKTFTTTVQITEDLKTFNSLSPDHLVGAGLYEIDHATKTIEFFGNSNNPHYHSTPLGPLEQIADTIKETTGFDTKINHDRYF